MRKIWYFSSKFDQHLSLYCRAEETGPGYWFLWESCGMISKIYWQFWHTFFKNVLESNYNFNPIEILWRKMVRSVCLKLVSMAMWRLHTWQHFTVPAYWITSLNLYGWCTASHCLSPLQFDLFERASLYSSVTVHNFSNNSSTKHNINFFYVEKVVKFCRRHNRVYSYYCTKGTI